MRYNSSLNNKSFFGPYPEIKSTSLSEILGRLLDVTKDSNIKSRILGKLGADKIFRFAC
jgi:hypothetical protein